MFNLQHKILKKSPLHNNIIRGVQTKPPTDPLGRSDLRTSQPDVGDGSAAGCRPLNPRPAGWLMGPIMKNRKNRSYHIITGKSHCFG